ncbi:MAG: hypothetical protein Q9176_007225 [Flavoplaca citrina]
MDDKKPNDSTKYAAQYFHPELCKLLNNAGADMNALTHKAKTPVQVAVLHNKSLYESTYAMLSDISDTLRLLTDSLDFMDQDGKGWYTLGGLCDASSVTSGERAAKIALLVWMLRLVSSEMKMYGCEWHYAELLSYTLDEDNGLQEASRLLLRLGGPKSIDSIREDSGYTILHIRAAFAEGRLNPVLAQGPDVHRLGCDFEWSPEEESPLSLALYSSRAFADWLDALVIARKEFEEYVAYEIQRNHATHPGWEKETLLNLSTYDYLIDYHPGRPWWCSDCTKRIWRLAVQPHWRHFLERIKHGIDPHYSPSEASSEVDEEESAEGKSMAEAIDNTDDPTGLDGAGSMLDAESESGSELEIESESSSESESESEWWEPEWELWDLNPHNYPTSVSLLSECVYCPHEVRLVLVVMPRENVILVDDALKNRTIKLLVREWSGGDKGR